MVTAVSLRDFRITAAVAPAAARTVGLAVRNASPCAALSAPASPAWSDTPAHLQELAEVATNPATTPTQAALITAIVAKTAQQWDRVDAICTPITVPRPGSRCIDRAQAWFLLGQSADARQRWLEARQARRQVRALTPTTHPLWVSASILDLEQAIRRQHLADAAAIWSASPNPYRRFSRGVAIWPCWRAACWVVVPSTQRRRHGWSEPTPGCKAFRCVMPSPPNTSCSG